MKNRYGGPLRKFISQHFRLKIYIDMAKATAFKEEVSAYPAVTIINRKLSKDRADHTRIARCPVVDEATLLALANALREPRITSQNTTIKEVSQIAMSSEPWLVESTDQMSLLRRLENEVPLLEETGCKVGIGVATGADKVFIQDFDTLDVEPECKLPLVTTKDIISGQVAWRGKGVINPFSDEGGLVPLSKYPRLRRYLESHREVVANRHCARKSPKNWYRTIDRITRSLRHEPKLLIPDIKGNTHVVFEKGEFYPHHNLYYITSSKWELRALQAMLMSCVAHLFIAMYSTKMRGGFLRFQAQYLRRS